MTINGVEFDVDFTDADTLELFDKGCQEVYEKAQKLKEEYDENLSLAEGIRQECKIVKDFFDYVLGEGASAKIFGEKNSLNLCLSTYEDVVNTFAKQYEEYDEKIRQYSPERINR